MTPSTEIKATMLEFYRRMLGGDADGANDLVSRDPTVVFIGSAGEWIDDQETFRSGRLDPGEGLVAGPAPVAYERDGVGWFADQPTWLFGDGTKAEMRVSAVLEREAPGWRIVHTHLSVAVPDDQCVMLQRRWKHGLPVSLPADEAPA
ncbi:MAG: nuclear transport factor 2 family protein [Chloroflexota bacterium]